MDLLLPECVDRTCFVEVRRRDEPDDAVALDRLEAEGTSSIRVLVPPGVPLGVTASGADGARLRSIDIAP